MTDRSSHSRRQVRFPASARRFTARVPVAEQSTLVLGIVLAHDPQQVPWDQREHVAVAAASTPRAMPSDDATADRLGGATSPCRPLHRPPLVGAARRADRGTR